MKRNEAVLLIAECLIEPHFPEDPEKEANYILKKLERYGILPPAYNLPDPVFNQIFPVHQWEPEEN